VADTQQMMGWVIGDHGFEMTLTKEVPKVIEAQLGAWVDGWLGRQGMKRSDIRSWAVHPGGPRILEAAENALGLEAGGLADSRGVLRDYGNMSSPTLLFIARRMMRGGAVGLKKLRSVGRG
jgi:predicted naringenin-chalcone synthase